MDMEGWKMDTSIYLITKDVTLHLHRILRMNDTWIVGEVYIFAKG